MNTLPTTCSVKGLDYVGYSDESLAGESIYSQPVTGCKSRMRARIYIASNKANTVDVICCFSC